MALLPLACTLTPPSSNLKQSPKIFSNPASTLFNNFSNTRSNKPVHMNDFRVSAKANDGSVGLATIQRKLAAEPFSEEEQKVVDAARKTRDEQWDMALETLLSQIKTIRRKIDTHFGDEKHVTDPMLVILDDVKSLVEIHKVNIGLKNPIPTTDAMMKVAKHFQAYRKSESDDGVIPVNARPKKTAISPMIDMFTEVANLLYGHRGYHTFLRGNFAPVTEETPPTEIKVVEGQLPSCIKGMLIRNGPNPQFDPLGKYQWLDGDGMLHATYFQGGKVTYASHYIQTSRFKQEQITGRAEFPKYGDYRGAFGVFTAFAQLLKAIFVLDLSYGSGVANENLAYHAGLLVALEDFDRPYAIKIKEDGDLETLGVYDFKNKLSHNCTPHTKKDPKTGELFLFGAAYTEPYMTYRVVAADGTMSDPLPIEVSGPTYMHDFCITENYVVIMDLPFTFNPEAMLKYNDWIYNYNPLKKPRFGIRPRDPKINSEVQWFEFDDKFFIYHTANSYEDGDKVIVYGCRIAPHQQSHDDSIPIIKSVLLCTALAGENYDLSLPELYKFTFDLKTGEATQEQVAENKVDYPKFNDSYMARKSRYVYTCEFNESSRSPAILKYDLEAEPQNRVTRIELGENIYGSEVAFVPSDNPTEEDDGYLLTYVCMDKDNEKGKSYVYVISAKTMEKVAALELPSRVPYGFHALFVNQDDIENQRKF